MHITYSCPNCSANIRREFTPVTRALQCPHCAQQIAVPTRAVHDQTIERCLVCPSRDLYIRKDIPQRLGVCVVLLGIVGSSIAWAYHEPYWTFGILFATALIDLLLYFIVGNCLMCYRCHAQYHGFEETAAHGPFNLETHERYRQMAARQLDSHRATTEAPGP